MENTRKYKRVYLIGVDGAGIFFKDTATPSIDRIFESGAVTYSAVTAEPSISAQCWGSMLIGVTPDVHGLTNGKAETMPYPTDSPYPTLFRRLREAYPECVLASFSNWSPINRGIAEQNVNVHFDSAGDAELTDRIVSYLNENDPDFLFVQLDDVDGAGHHHGYGAEGHLDAITRADCQVGKIYDTLAERGLLEDALFIVTADHGGTPEGGHGGDSNEELKIFFGAAGKTVKKQGKIGEMSVWDIPAVVMYAFGLELPEFALDGFVGQIPAGLFEGYVPSERKMVGRRSFIHTHRDTPSDVLGQYACKEAIMSALFFDGNANDFVSGNETEICGKLKFYSAGYYGDCAELGSRGYVKIPAVKLGRESFSVSLWINRDYSVPEGHLPTIFATSDIADVEHGVAYCFDNHRTVFKVAGISTELDIPVCFGDGWTNFIIVVDREANTVTQYVNFDKPVTHALPESVKGMDFDHLPFTVGNDATGSENDYLNFFTDDFILFRGALTGEVVTELDKYYNL